MPFLTETLPIDRYAKCFFGENFTSALSVAQNGGTIYGTPEINHGINLNGTTDYIIYNSTGWFIDKDPWSCNIEFWPDFAVGDDVQRRLFTCGAGAYTVNKRAAANSHVLRIALGTTTIVDVALATYGGLWVQGVRNLLTISATSGATDAWFNGTQIVTADATAWAPSDETDLTIGGTNAGGDLFDGHIKMFKMYNTLLSEADHRYLWGQ